MSCPLCGDVCRCNPELRHLASPDEQLLEDACLQEANASPPLQNSGSSALRREIAARVHRYRSRRTYRGPRYPSLRLKFEPGETFASANGVSPVASSEAAVRQSLSTENAVSPPRSVRGVSGGLQHSALNPNAVKASESMLRDAAAKVIEFPRCVMTPIALDELAESMIDRPRILDVPEPAPPPPALGGILMGPVEEKEPEKRPGLDVPLQSAALDRRLLAAAADACLVLVATAVFEYLWFRITHIAPSLRFALIGTAAVAGVFWATYHYLFLVYTGTTLGLKAAKLELSRFDGTRPSRTLRRWRVLVSLLSGLSLGMGFLWCFLDEDALCWHDRITRTYLAPNLATKPRLQACGFNHA